MTNHRSLGKGICVLLLVALLLSLSACGSGKTEVSNKLSFQQALSFDYLKELDGKEVIINGYLATSSPVDGSFIFLMNLPFQSCPFCVPNTSQLSNTMEVYPKKGESFTYTNQAVKVVGTLVVAEQEDQPFTDAYGYEFSFKLVDASYTILKGEDISAEMALWQKFASTDVITEVNRMYEYVNFVCTWNEYFVNSGTDSEGNTHPGYYLYASDAMNYLEKDDGQFHYGYNDHYFDDIIASIQAIDPTAFEPLVENIRAAKQLADDALNELKNGNYTYEEQYVEKFQATDNVYTITNGEALRQRMETLFSDFSNWLGGWEM